MQGTRHRDLPRRRPLLLVRPLPRARREHRAPAAGDAHPGVRRRAAAAQLLAAAGHRVGREAAILSSSSAPRRRRRRGGPALHDLGAARTSSHPAARSSRRARERALDPRRALARDVGGDQRALPLVHAGEGARRAVPERPRRVLPQRPPLDAAGARPRAQHDAARRADRFPLAGRDARARRPDGAHPRHAPPHAAPRGAATVVQIGALAVAAARVLGLRGLHEEEAGARQRRERGRVPAVRAASRARCATACAPRWASSSGSPRRGTAASPTPASGSTPSTTGSTTRRRPASPPPNMPCSPASSTKPAPPAASCRAVSKAKSRRPPPRRRAKRSSGRSRASRLFRRW